MNETLRDNYTGWRGRSVAGGMPEWALLSKWEQTGVGEDINQVRNMHRSELRDFSCEKPWLEADETVNGGIDPVTGQSRAGGSRSRGILNLRFGGARNNTSPYLPDGTFLDHEFLDNKDDYVDNKERFTKNYTAGKAGVSRMGGGVNWNEYNRQRAYRGKYVKYYSDADPSTVEHAISAPKMQENLMKARFTGLKKLQRKGRTLDGRKPGKTVFYERNGEKNYHAIDQQFREEKIGTNYRQWSPDDTNAGHQYIDQDQDINEGKYGRDNPTYISPGDVEKAQRAAKVSERVMTAFRDNNVQRSLAYIISTLNNSNVVSGTQYTTEGFTNNQRKLGITKFNAGTETQMNSIESRAYEIARALQNEISNRKLGAQTYGNQGQIQMNSFIDPKVAEYMAMANRKLGPLEVTLNLKEASLHTSLQPGAEVMDFMNSNKKSMAIDVLDLPRSQLNSKIAHYRDDSRATMNFSGINPKISCNITTVDGEQYGLNSDESIRYKSAQPLYTGLKSAYFSQDMKFQEGAVDVAHRSQARGKGQTRRQVQTAHNGGDSLNEGDMNEIGHNTRN